MSTRSSILIQIPDEYIGKTFKYQKVPFEVTWDLDTDLTESVTFIKLFAGIYCHHDGYPDGVGKELIEHYNTFESAFNLILGGDCSSIVGDYVRYATQKSEDWKHIQPHQFDKIQKVSSDSQYVYVFKNNRWYLYTGDLLLMLPKDVLSLDDYIRGYYDGVEDGITFARFK